MLSDMAMNASYDKLDDLNVLAISYQCKEIEENNRVGTTRDLFRKIGAVKGLFHGRMSMIKDRNREINKTSQEYTKELYKKRTE